MIVYDVFITRKVSDHPYDIGVMGQGQKDSKSVLWLKTRISLSVLTKGVHIWRLN